MTCCALADNRQAVVSQAKETLELISDAHEELEEVRRMNCSRISDVPRFHNGMFGGTLFPSAAFDQEMVPRCVTGIVIYFATYTSLVFSSG